MAATSVLEPVVLLFQALGDKRYLDFAKYIVSNYDAFVALARAARGRA